MFECDFCHQLHEKVSAQCARCKKKTCYHCRRWVDNEKMCMVPLVVETGGEVI